MSSEIIILQNQNIPANPTLLGPQGLCMKHVGTYLFIILVYKQQTYMLCLC